MHGKSVVNGPSDNFKDHYRHYHFQIPYEPELRDPVLPNFIHENGWKGVNLVEKPEFKS